MPEPSNQRPWSVRLDECVDVWRADLNESSNLEKVFRHWRGRPNRDPNSPIITLVEYTRQACLIAWSDHATLSLHLEPAKKAAEKILAIGPLSAPQYQPHLAAAQAMARGVLTIACWAEHKPHLSDFVHTVAYYNKFCESGGVRPKAVMKADNILGNERLKVLQEFLSLITESTLNDNNASTEPDPELNQTQQNAVNTALKLNRMSVLMLSTLFAYMLGHKGSNDFHNRIRVLFASPDQETETGEGYVAKFTLGRSVAPRGGVCFDPIALGITQCNDQMIQSLWNAAECLSFSKNLKKVAVRIYPELPANQFPVLNGPSAGCMWTAGSYATACYRDLNPDYTATGALKIPEDRSKRFAGVEVVKVGGILPKMKAAQREGISRVYMQAENASLWKKRDSQLTRARAVKDLDALIKELTYDNELLRLREIRDSHGSAWHAMVTAERTGSNMTLNLPAIRENHHLQFYIPFQFKFETTPSRYFSDQASMAARNSDIEARLCDVPQPPRNHEPLTNLLRMVFRQPDTHDYQEVVEPFRSNAMRPPRHLLIYDRAGAGKSVCSHRIFHLLNQQDSFRYIVGHESPYLVLRLDSTSFTRCNLKTLLVTELTRTRANLSPKTARSTIEFVLKHQRLIVIVDGLDQFNKKQLVNFSKVLSEPANSQCRWIITSRPHIAHCQAYVDASTDDWLRAHILPFNHKQQRAYFNKCGLNHVWSLLRGGIASQWLGCPAYLDQLRAFASEYPSHLANSFESESQLVAVTSRMALMETLKPILRVDNPCQLTQSQALTLLEETLGVMAFELASQGHWDGKNIFENLEEKITFERNCLARFCAEVKAERDRFSNKRHAKEQREHCDKKIKMRRELWQWSERVARRTELDQHTQGIIEFRNRKTMEYYLARYLTAYASEQDAFGHQTGPCLCAWDFIADPQWQDTWKLAINMPQQPFSGVSAPEVSQAVMHPLRAGRSLSTLFRVPKCCSVGRPTELLYRCWPLFVEDDQDFIPQHSDKALHERTNARIPNPKQLLGAYVTQADKAAEIARLRELTLIEFRQNHNPIVFQVRDQLATPWQNESCKLKSHTMMRCIEPAPLASNLVTSDPKRLEVQATTVTRVQFRKFNPGFEQWAEVAYKIDRYSSADDVSQTASDDWPIICVNWYDAWAFCKWLGPDFRLPSEEEWEFACRAGTQGPFHWGASLDGSQAKCDESKPYGLDAAGRLMLFSSRQPSGPTDKEGTSKVAQYACNEFGLFDMHGNVTEWCANWSSKDSGNRAARGGAWNKPAEHCTASFPDRYPPDQRFYFLGFRVFRSCPSMQELPEDNSRT